MKLYYLPGACPLATHIVLEWIGKPYELQRMARDELKKPEFLALNPVGSVPVLTDGDFVLTQSSAILEYLADLNPQADLLPQELQARAEVRRWLAFCNADLHRTFALIFGAQGYTSNPECQQELISATAARLVMLFGIADAQLEGKRWVAGTRSLADPYLYTLLRWARAKDIDLSTMQNLQAFYARIEADSGVQAALKAQGLQV
ncbi:MAG: glutathione S-transferase N-terminal domain-containing protein [Burkholderiaceae bacterium]|nr:glutathione S-transferase N-terminal domain-containing protein [Burkholderiaceae bacterium]